jgi:Lipid A 3-O-deacylase (PagL)
MPRHTCVIPMCSGRPAAPDPTSERHLSSKMRAVYAFFATLSLAPTLAAAQSSPNGAPRPADRFIGAWIGMSVAPSTRFSPITDRHFFVAGLRAQYVLETFGPITIASHFDFIPLAILSNTPEYEVRSTRMPDGSTLRTYSETGRSAAMGAGVVPAGLQIYTLSIPPLRLFIGGSAGVLGFTRNTPVPEARRFNFVMEAGAGAEVLSRDGRAVIVGYRFNHLSNGGTAEVNPGVDTHFLYLGFMRARNGRRHGNGTGR